MNHIFYAAKSDIADIYSLMQSTHASMDKKDWYVADDMEFLERHIEQEGYTLKYVIGGKIAAFLVVRHPGTAEDNLGRELLAVACASRTHDTSEFAKVQLDRVSHMESAVVAPSYRGRGLQAKLLQKAEEIERARESEYLMATVHPDNVYSLCNLLKAGYECILDTEKYGGLPRKVLCKKL